MTIVMLPYYCTSAQSADFSLRRAKLVLYPAGLKNSPQGMGIFAKKIWRSLKTGSVKGGRGIVPKPRDEMGYVGASRSYNLEVTGEYPPWPGQGVSSLIMVPSPYGHVYELHYIYKNSGGRA
jgi:hypothetical protein